MSKPIGIDLGTTYSAIARWNDAGLAVGPECYNFRLEERNYVASKIYIPDLGNRDDVMYGKGAIRYCVREPDKFYSAFKRGMDDNSPIKSANGEITPVELSSLLIKHMFENAVNPVEGAGFIPEGVAVSVPYYFTEPPKINTCKSLSDALESVYGNNLQFDESLNLKTVPEPIAAGLDYAFSFLNDLRHQNILIFDLGGGTFDVTAYELINSPEDKKLEFTVLATDGHERLGGEDFDASIRKYILDKNGVDENMEQDPKYKIDRAQLYLQTTEAKCVLSSVNSTEIVISPFFGQPLLQFRITEQDIQRILKGEAGMRIDYMSKIEDIVDRCLDKAELSPNMVDRIVLVGGSSNIPCIKRMLEQKFGVGKMYQSPIPSETVARGACIYATYLLDKANKDNPNYHRHLHYWDEIKFKPKNAHNLGIVLSNNRVDTIIQSNIFTPVSGTRVYIPSEISEDGATAVSEPLIVKQGQHVIGSIPIPTIYTHGRSRREINISVTLLAESTDVKVIIHVPKGNEDGTDLHTEGEIQIH